MLRFEEIREDLLNRPWKKILSLQLQIRPYLYGVPYWIAAVFVGLIAVLFSSAFSGLINFMQTVTVERPYLLLALSPCCFAISAWLVVRFAPGAGGTGVPNVIRALSVEAGAATSQIGSILDLKVGVVVILSSLFGVLGGASLGREGPMVQIAACVFYTAGRQLKKIWPTEEHRSWIVAGGAAGVAAAFNTPLAGIVFVLEELAQQHFHQFKTVIISAVIVAGMVAQWLYGRYLFLGDPHIPSVPLSCFPWVILVGVICGVVAGLFERTLGRATQRVDQFRADHTLLFAGVIGILMACMARFVSPQSIGGGIKLIESLLFHTEHPARWNEVFVRFFGPLISHLSGCAGGFLAPSLALGAAVASKFSMFFSPQHHNLLVLVGMASMLSAISRAPFTALVIVMEMTNLHSIIFPLMLGTIVSQAVVRALAGREAK